MAENDIMNEIEAEIKKAKGDVEDFEIEVIDDPVQEAKEEAVNMVKEKVTKKKKEKKKKPILKTFS